MQAIAKSQVLSNVSASEFESVSLNDEVLKPRQKLSALKLTEDSTFFLKLKKATPSFPSFPFGDEEDSEAPKKLDENGSEEGDKDEKKEDEKEVEKEEGPKGPDAVEEEKDKKKEKKEEHKGFAVTRKDIIDKVSSEGILLA